MYRLNIADKAFPETRIIKATKAKTLAGARVALDTAMYRCFLAKGKGAVGQVEELVAGWWVPRA